LRERIDSLPVEAKKQLRDTLAAKRDQLVIEQRLERATSAQRLLSSYLYDPVGFARDLIFWKPGQGLVDYQQGILQDLVDHRRVAVRGPHGLGKTGIVGIAVLWFALTRDAAGVDWKAITTAGAWRQLTRYLWPEIHKWAPRLRWDRLGRPEFDPRRELLEQMLKLRHGEAFPVASNDAALIEGAHADSLLYVYDEAKAIPAATFDAVEGAFSGARPEGLPEAFAIAVSTPGEPSGRFYDIHARKPGLDDWHARHVTLADAIAAGRVSADWAEDRAAQWGRGSAVFANRVLGEFHSSDEDAVIPLAWVEAAVERWHAWVDEGRPVQPGRRVVGVDVARSGEDLTVQAIRQGRVVEELRVYAKQDTMVTAGKVGGVLNGAPHVVAVVDTDGLGAGVTDRLRERGFAIIAFHAGQAARRGKTPITDRSGELKFVNVRSAAWWNLREMLDPAYGEQVCLPPDDKLIGDLTAPHWTVLSGSKIQIEKREDLVKRLGRSPDRGTAVVHAFWTPSSIVGGDASSGYVPYTDDLSDDDDSSYATY
jgi:hypothetical protein